MSIGGGIAGLAAGCCGQMSGLQTQVFELHDKPGGLCTAWKRRGYTFDGCIHWLVGSRDGSGMNHMWQELGAAQGRTFIDHEEFTRVEGSDGRAPIVYTGEDRVDGVRQGDVQHAARACRLQHGWPMRAARRSRADGCQLGAFRD
jgi:phytoene dehydrogenase-like protein